METKMIQKVVEKKDRFTVADITVLIKQNLLKEGKFICLNCEYRIVYSDDDQLSRFISDLKNVFIRPYKKYLSFTQNYTQTVVINSVDPADYSIDDSIVPSAYLVLDDYVNISIHDLNKSTRSLVSYSPNLK